MKIYSTIRSLRRFCQVSALVLGIGITHIPVHAQSPESVKAALMSHTKGTLNISTVTATPANNVYEVVLADTNEIIYVDGSGRYAFIEGAMMDLATKANITRDRIDQLGRIDFNALPLGQAIVSVRGSGQRKLAVFEDPNCPHCRNLRKLLDGMDDVTVYAFPFPILTRESVEAAKTAYCAPDRKRVWASTMQTGKLPAGMSAAAPGSKCGAPVDAFIALGEKLKVIGTPTVFLANGERIAGAIPPHEFVARVDRLK